jgi:hypothetical protein
MLPTNFADLSRRLPRLRPALEALERWIRANPSIDFIDLRLVMSEMKDIDPAELAVALVALEKQGILREKFGLIAPTNHALADDFFDSKEDIPPKAYDTTDRSFDTDDAEIVSVYVGSPQ